MAATAGVGLEQVGGHTGAVTDVVTDVVGDGSRVARVVLGNSGFYFTDQVGADVGTLGEDAAAQTGENGDQAAAESKGDQGDDVMREVIVTGYRGQGQTGHDHTGDRSAFESQSQAGGQSLFRRLRPYARWR